MTFQFTNNIQLPPPDTTSKFHPDEFAKPIGGIGLRSICSTELPLATALWNMTDFSITTRHEGDTLGQNDKGLITRDRQTYKDSYYFYQANWNGPSRTWANTPVLYISDHTWTDRTTSSVSMTGDSNRVHPRCGKTAYSLAPWCRWCSANTIPDTYTMSSNLALAAGAEQHSSSSQLQQSDLHEFCGLVLPFRGRCQENGIAHRFHRFER